MFQRGLGRRAEDATPDVESEHRSRALSAFETPQDHMRPDMRCDPTSSHPALQHQTPIVEHNDPGLSLAPRSGVYDLNRTVSDPKDREIRLLQRTLTEAKTANREREAQLLVAKEGLKNAREALNETFAEYTGVREELKTVKQALDRDHQAIVYRKDIEIFALRKINEQREKNLIQRDAELEEMERHHRATLEVKEEQLRLLKDRLAVMELSGGSQQDKDDRDHALEVRLLKVKKGRKSSEVDDDKDAIILHLQEELAVARRSAEAVVNQQAELQRAWDITKKIQGALKEERDRHTQTREQLQGMTMKLSDEGNHEHNPADSAGRLATIEEDENDQSELQAMLDAVQQKNSELNTKVSVLEKRLQDANTRLFSAAHEAEALRDQVRFEQAKKHELENARLSMVHHVHLQRLEDELKDSHDIIAAKNDEIRRHKKSIAEIDRYVGRLRREIDAAVRFHTEDQEEIESLKQTISELERTKQQLMVDHEHQASYRVRPRIPPAENNSTRYSGTPNQESSPQLTRSSDATAASPVEALPPMSTRTKHKSRGRARSLITLNIPSALSNMVSNDEPVVDQRDAKTTRRTSLGLRDMIKRIARKDEDDSEVDPVQEASRAKEFDRSRMRNALTPMAPDAISRPATATATSSVPADSVAPVARRPIPANATTPERMGPSDLRRTSMRYYATLATEEDERPSTATSKEVKKTRHMSWGASVQTKLKRRSLH